jgi:hypothetical protein
MRSSIRITLNAAEQRVVLAALAGAIDDDEGGEDTRTLASVENKIRVARIRAADQDCT